MQTLTSDITGSAAILVKRWKIQSLFFPTNLYTFKKGAVSHKGTSVFIARKRRRWIFLLRMGRRVGRKQSSSTLRMMIQEKRKFKGWPRKFLRYLKTDDEKNYFRLLISYAHAACLKKSQRCGRHLRSYWSY